MTSVNGKLQTSTPAEYASYTRPPEVQQMLDASHQKLQEFWQDTPHQVEEMVSIFKKADKNGDGSASIGELTAYKYQLAGAPPPGMSSLDNYLKNIEPIDAMLRTLEVNGKQGYTEADIRNAATKGGDPTQWDAGDGLQLGRTLRVKADDPNSIQKFQKTMDVVEQANLYPDSWNTGAAYLPSQVRHEVSKSQLQQFLSLSVNTPGVGTEDRERAQFMLNHFDEIAGSDGKLSQLDLFNKAAGGDYKLTEADFAPVTATTQSGSGKPASPSSSATSTSTSASSSSSSCGTSSSSSSRGANAWNDFCDWMGMLIIFFGFQRF